MLMRTILRVSHSLPTSVSSNWVGIHKQVIIFVFSDRTMFLLAELEYIIRVEPRRFGKDMKREVTDELNRKFANKVCI